MSPDDAESFIKFKFNLNKKVKFEKFFKGNAVDNHKCLNSFLTIVNSYEYSVARFYSHIIFQFIITLYQ